MSAIGCYYKFLVYRLTYMLHYSRGCCTQWKYHACLCTARWQSALYLYGVVQGRASWMQRQILERFDLRRFPAALLRPVDSQHVVRELFAEEQRGGLGLRLAFCVAFNGETCCLRWRRKGEPDTGGEKKEGRRRTRAEQATKTVIVFLKLLLLTQHAQKDNWRWLNIVR